MKLLFDGEHSKKLIDRLIYIGGTLGPLMTIPQLFKIWIGRNATGVSVISWGAYAAGSFFWIWYGISYKQKPIIFTYSLFFIIEVLIIIGTFIYG
jgi:uncharacterized protein with PQ loop repeat